MSDYISDATRVAQQMGQYQLWCGKLFRWSGERLGWRFIKDIPQTSQL